MEPEHPPLRPEHPPLRPEHPPLRVDAALRRRRILDAAAQVLAEEGADVPMERIARAAGVGVGTLYRRFPDRTALILEVTRDNLERLVAVARTALQDEATGWDALVRIMDNPSQLRLVLRPSAPMPPGVPEALRADPGLRALRGQMMEVLQELVGRAQAEGSMRPDVGVGDVALLLATLRRRPHVPEAVGAAATTRLRRLVLDALSTGPRAPLVGDPLGVADLGFTDATIPASEGTRGS
ncbi:TetR/AcrR family transcriptional regulator [Arsenicicoccus sp. oral taxon 190]|uniref:TetR/AcrR family transcriptional regulator n=1 Tax=Arsenicicoccus sp. oral taxon 190 TaxID=1658671 RepID=UPI00067A1F52|nr:TetR/AcrR family transcriptional regulator [Arsenicicoccus sp. oral taxon 190]AKT51006.1 hypothetical protein ADJ73_06165 [Arsenicicoccus sp. oral taxon 190]